MIRYALFVAATFTENPCENYTNCHANATCIPIPALGLAFCRCADGLMGDGTRDCFVPDPCHNESTCDVNAQCVSYGNGSFSCDCKTGYTMVGKHRSIRDGTCTVVSSCYVCAVLSSRQVLCDNTTRGLSRMLTLDKLSLLNVYDSVLVCWQTRNVSRWMSAVTRKIRRAA